MGVNSGAAVIRNMEGQIQHNFEDDHEEAVSHDGDLFLELREVTAQHQVHNFLALVLWQ